MFLDHNRLPDEKPNEQDDEVTDDEEELPNNASGTTGVDAKETSDTNSVDSDDDDPPAESAGVELQDVKPLTRVDEDQAELEREMEARYGPRIEG